MGAGGARASTSASSRIARPFIQAIVPLAKMIGPKTGAIVSKALPILGWVTVVGSGVYEMQNALLGNQVAATTNAANVEAQLAAQQHRFDQELAAEKNRQNARDVAAAYTRGLTESAAKLPPAPPPPPAGQVLTNASIAAMTVPGPATTKSKLAAAWSSFMSSPVFLPVLGAGLAILSRPSSSSPRDFPAFEEPPLTGFQEGPVEFLGGNLAGVDPELFPQPAESAADGEPCEKIEPKREPGQCRQGWFAETPTKLLLKEWSRRPCQ